MPRMNERESPETREEAGSRVQGPSRRLALDGEGGRGLGRLWERSRGRRADVLGHSQSLTSWGRLSREGWAPSTGLSRCSASCWSCRLVPPAASL